MHIVFYDTETTGFSSRDEVVQIAGLVTTMDLTIVKVFNRYCFTNARMNPDALAIHGLDRQFLLKASKGKYLEEVLEEIELFNMKNAIYVAFNDKFDRRLINQTLSNNGAAPIDFGKTLNVFDRQATSGRYNLCAMKLLSMTLNRGVNCKLETLIKTKAGVSYDVFLQYYKEFLKRLSIFKGKETFHDALFDSFCVLWLTKKYKGLLFT